MPIADDFADIRRRLSGEAPKPVAINPDRKPWCCAIDQLRCDWPDCPCDCSLWHDLDPQP